MTANFTTRILATRILATRVLVAAATVVVAAGAASAQNLKAEIPFPFRADNKVMAAGTYRISVVTRSGGVPVFSIRSQDGSNGIMLMAKGINDPAKEWTAAGQPLLTFECGATRCTLSGLWTGYGAPAYTMPHPKAGDEPVHIATIVMHAEKGD